jgi:Fe-S cluster biogenesis protein NfuA
VDEGTVNLQMVGACGGCPMSMMTLKAGIERILMDRVPGVVAVNAQ